MTAEPQDLEDVDLLAANLGDVRDPYIGYAAAREKAAAAPVDHMGAAAFMVYRYAESEQVLKDGDTFSARINGRWMRPLLGRTILEMDGSEHTVHRSLIGHAFRPRAVAQWEDTLIRPIVHELIDAFAARGRAELVKEFAWLLPVKVFARILGIPGVDEARWQRWAIALNRAALDWKAAVAASEEVRAFFQPIIDARRERPGAGDLIDDLVSSEVDGRTLDDDLIHGFVRLLIPAGAETTYRLLGNVLFALLSHPDQLKEVTEDRSLLPGAIEETLRWESPVQFSARETTCPAHAGRDIPEDSAVTVAIGSANRDESRWDAPEDFDVRREPQTHLAFGGGAHLCLGAHLARLEAHVALHVLLDRLPNLRLDGDAYMTGFAFRSPTSLPVAFDPERQ